MALNTTNYFTILNVSRDATEKEIKMAYTQMLRQYPPERPSEEFSLIQEAYKVLSNAEERQKYETSLNDYAINKQSNEEIFNYDSALTKVKYLINEGQFSKAKNVLQQLQSRGFGNDKEVLTIATTLALTTKDITGAKSYLSTIEQWYPDDAVMQRYICEQYNTLGDSQKVIALARPFIEKHLDVPVFIELIEAYNSLKQYDMLYTLMKEKVPMLPVAVDNIALYKQSVLLALKEYDYVFLQQLLPKLSHIPNTQDRDVALKYFMESIDKMQPSDLAFKAFLDLLDIMNQQNRPDTVQFAARKRTALLNAYEYVELYPKETVAMQNIDTIEIREPKIEKPELPINEGSNNQLNVLDQRVKQRKKSKWKPIVVSMAFIALLLLSVLSLADKIQINTNNSAENLEEVSTETVKATVPAAEDDQENNQEDVHSTTTHEDEDDEIPDFPEDYSATEKTTQPVEKVAQAETVADNSSGDYIVILEDATNIRQAGNINSKKVFTANEGDSLLYLHEKVNIPSDDMAWYKVQFGSGNVGYVSSQLADTTADRPAYVRITEYETNIRDAATLNSHSIVKADKGNMADFNGVIEHSSDGRVWLGVTLEDGTDGYVSQKVATLTNTFDGSYIDYAGEESYGDANGSYDSGVSEGTVYVNHDEAKVRSSPKITDDNIIYNASIGDTYEYTGKTYPAGVRSWYEVYVDGGVGYISSRVSDLKQ